MFEKTAPLFSGRKKKENTRSKYIGLVIKEITSGGENSTLSQWISNSFVIHRATVCGTRVHTWPHIIPFPRAAFIFWPLQQNVATRSCDFLSAIEWPIPSHRIDTSKAAAGPRIIHFSLSFFLSRVLVAKFFERAVETLSSKREREREKV